MKNGGLGGISGKANRDTRSNLVFRALTIVVKGPPAVCRRRARLERVVINALVLS